MDGEYVKELIKDAEEIGDQVARYYDKGLLSRLKKTDIEVVRAFKTRYEAIGYQYKYGLITSEEYYDKLAQIRDIYFSRDSQEWHKYTAEIYDYKVGELQEYKKAVEENLEEILEVSREKFAQVEKEQGQYAQKLTDYAGGMGFERHLVQVDNYYPNGGTLKFNEYSITDFDKEINDLKEFNQSIEELKEKASDISPDVLQMFFSGLRDMPIEDAKIFADVLVSKSDEEIKKYFESYQERNELADIVSKNLYKTDFENVAKEMKEDLETEFSTIPDEFFVYGELTGATFKEGFQNEVEGLFDEIMLNIDVANTPTGAPEEAIQNIFSPTYYFFGDRETTSRTRLHAKDDVLYMYMRGME